MPPNLVTGEDADSVAAFVASVVGKPVAGGGATAAGAGNANDPRSIFTASCGSCHVFEAAGTKGTVGPNLDQAKPGLEEARRQITNGGGGMPAFRDQLTREQIDALAKYVSGAGK